MRITSHTTWFATVAVTAVITAGATSAQAPPQETRFHVLADVGPLPVPASCGCVTAPFTFMPPRPGWRYGNGPGAPDTDAPPSKWDIERQKALDRETLAHLPTMYQHAVEGSDASSFSIAMELLTGTLLKRDPVKATQWFIFAASQGHPNAAAHAGHRYLRGIGIEPNDVAAAYWYYRGAEAGDKPSMTALGGLYAAGRGVPQSWPLALEWWRKAGAWRFVADAYACGLGVPQSMDDALQTYSKASEAGDMQSVMQLGNIHAGGCARVPDVDVALKFYEQAAGEGYPEAQVLFGELLLREGARRSPGRAYLWARIAELRLPDGELRTRAQLCAAQAARELPPAFTDSSDEMARGIVTGGSEPMKR